MGVYGGPNKVKGGIVFSLDGANPASYAGDVDGATRSASTPAGTPYGYVGHGLGSPGNPSPAVSTVNRIDYSNDTPTTSTKGPLSDANNYTEGTGSRSYGYVMGGSGPMSSHCRRIDYSSDTDTATNKGPLSAIKWEGGATGNNSYGYYGGGYAPATSAKVSSVDRLDYSSDTTTAAPKGPLTATFYRTAATGNTSYGYWASMDPNSSLVARIDYSNDTPTATAKGPLASTHGRASATGNGDYGYWGGGDGPTSKVQRLDYSSDTTVAAKGPLSQARSLGTATGSTSYGYFAGGNIWPNSTSTVDRIDFSNDTATAVAKGSLNNSLYGQSAVSSQANSLGSETVYPWYDTSGRGNTANITDSRFRATDGGYFTFDGTGDYLTVPSTTDFAFGTGDFTVEYWVKTPATPQGTDYGYVAGGGSGAKSTVDRIDFNNDTATAVTKGPLPEVRQSGSATGNASYGYFGGGEPGPKEIDRIDYSNDTATALRKGELVYANPYQGSVGNSDYGYWAGTYPSTSAPTTIARLDYSSDSTNALSKGTLMLGVWVGGTGNQSYGYFGGSGWYPSDTRHSTIQRIQYSNDTATALEKGPFPADRCNMFAGAGNADYGYWAGGLNGPGSTVSTVDRVDYSNDTPTASPKGPLSTTIKYHAVTSSSSHGYIAGGGPGPVSSVDRIDFSNDTATAAPKGPITSARYAPLATSSRANALPTADVITAANIINPDSETGSGYWAHQYDTTFDWNSEYVGAGPAYGYIAGGAGNPTVSSVSRIDYSNDTPTATAKGPLSTVRRDHAGTGNASYGYFGAGSTYPGPPRVSTVDRIDYSSDTDTAAVKGPLSREDQKVSAVGNASYGYWAGGYPGGNVSTIDRLDFSSDTTTAAVKGPLSSHQQGLSAGTGTQSYGYIGGGDPARSTVDRIDYSNDTPTASPKGPLTVEKKSRGATGNSSYGYWAGGKPASITTTDRLDYSSDTDTAVTKGPLSAGRYYLSATGSASYGWFAGGGYPAVSTVDRIDYSNDTATASARGHLEVAKYATGAASAQGNALPVGSTELYTCALSPVNDGSWHNVVMTRKGGTQQTYYDGVGITTTAGTYTDSTNYSGVDGWLIGKGNPSVGVSTFSGDLANITIRKGKGLSSDEVQQNFNALRSRFGV